MKRAIVIIILLLFVTLCLSCRKEIKEIEIMKNVTSKCQITGNPDINQLVSINDKFDIPGSNCSVSVRIKEISYGSATFIVSYGNEEDEIEVDYQKTGYSEAGFYIHIVDLFKEHARVAINTGLDFDFSANDKKMKECFTNPDCMLTCDDMNGFFADSCPDFSKEASGMPFKSKIKDNAKCCVYIPATYYVLPSKRNYYVGDSIKLFFFGPEEISCQITLKNPIKSFSENSQECQPFSQILSRDLMSNYGEIFGNWDVIVKLPSKFGKNLTARTDFTYHTGSIIWQEFQMEKGEKKTFTFEGNQFILKHQKGCNYGVDFTFWNNDTETNFTMDIGASEELGVLSVNLRGAPCREEKPLTVRITKVMKSACRNNICEADETDKSCPWDCFEPEAIDKGIPLEPKTACTNGCYYDKTCIAESAPMKIGNTTYACSNNEWVKKGNNTT